MQTSELAFKGSYAHIYTKYTIVFSCRETITDTLWELLSNAPKITCQTIPIILMMHGQCRTLEPGVCAATNLQLCNSYQKLTRFACVTLTYRISQRQENIVCPERKPVGGTGGWQAGCSMALSVVAYQIWECHRWAWTASRRRRSAENSRVFQTDCATGTRLKNQWVLFGKKWTNLLVLSSMLWWFAVPGSNRKMNNSEDCLDEKGR